MKKGIFAILTILFFCNFGRVEYSALHPKAKTIQVDSTTKSVQINSSKIIKTEADQADQETKEASEENIVWSKFVILGIKTIFASLLKMVLA